MLQRWVPCLNKKWSLRRQLLTSFISASAVSLVIALAVVLLSTNIIGNRAKDETRKSLEAQIVRQLETASSGAAAIIGEKFRRLQYGVLDVTSFAFRDAMQEDLVLDGNARGYPLTPNHKDLRDVWINSSSSSLVTSVKQNVQVDLGRSVWYYSDGTSFDTPIPTANRSKIESSARMDLFWPTMYNISDETLALYVAFAVDSDNRAAFRRFPGRALSSEDGTRFACEFSPQGQCYDPTKRDWYRNATDKNVSNTTQLGDVAVTDPYITASGGEEWIVTLARTIYNDTGSASERHLLGVVGVDVKLQELQTAINKTSFLDTGYSMLVTAKKGTILAAPDRLWNRSEEVNTTTVCELVEGICGTNNNWTELVQAGESGTSIEIPTNSTNSSTELFLLVKQVNVAFDIETDKETDIHYIVSVVVVDEIFETVNTMEDLIQRSTTEILVTTTIAAVLTLFVVGVAVCFKAESISRPIATMTENAKSIARDGAKTGVFGGVTNNWTPDESGIGSANGSHGRECVTDYLLCRGPDELDTLMREFGLMITGLGKRGKAAKCIGLEDYTVYPTNPFTIAAVRN